MLDENEQFLLSLMSLNYVWSLKRYFLLTTHCPMQHNAFVMRLDSKENVLKKGLNRNHMQLN